LTNAQPVNSSLNLFVFADALGWTEVRKRVFMEDLFPFRQSCETIFGYSCTCDPSILTGCLPQDHGHFSFFVRAQGERPFAWAKYFGWLPEALAGHHRIRNRISRWVARKQGYSGYFQLYSVPFSRLPWLDYTEKRDIYEPGGILGGQPTIFELWQASGRPWMRSDWRRDDATNVASLLQTVDRDEVELAYLFTAGLDAVMHAHTVDGPQTNAAFDRFEKWLQKIHALACKRYRDVRLHLFSDHGMTNTQAVSPMLKDFERLGLRFGRDYAAVWDSTM
jgi:type I phosphodiesterase/nucleotide pyrophosphatase